MAWNEQTTNKKQLKEFLCYKIWIGFSCWFSFEFCICSHLVAWLCNFAIDMRPRNKNTTTCINIFKVLLLSLLVCFKMQKKKTIPIFIHLLPRFLLSLKLFLWMRELVKRSHHHCRHRCCITTVCNGQYWEV